MGYRHSSPIYEHLFVYDRRTRSQGALREPNWSLRHQMRKRYQKYPFGVRKRSWAQGHVSAFDIIRISAWKSARLPADLSVNSPTLLETVTREAISHMADSQCALWQPLGNDNDNFWDRYEFLVRLVVGSDKESTGLYALNGLQYPIASAILCVLDPHLFPVIDQHAVRAIYGRRARDKDHKKWHCAHVYSHYARQLSTTIYDIYPTYSIHKLDVQAMRVGKWLLQNQSRGDHHPPTARHGWPPPTSIPQC